MRVAVAYAEIQDIEVHGVHHDYYTVDVRNEPNRLLTLGLSTVDHLVRSYATLLRWPLQESLQHLVRKKKRNISEKGENIVSKSSQALNNVSTWK